MLCTLIRLTRKARDLVARAVRCSAQWLDTHLRRLWTRHLDKVSTSTAYAAATAAVIGAVVGLEPVREVIAIVLTTFFGVYLRSSGFGSSTRRVDPWDLG